MTNKEKFIQAHFNLNKLIEDIKNIAESVKKSSGYKDVRNILGLKLDDFEIILCADLDYLKDSGYLNHDNKDFKKACDKIELYYNDFDKLINSVIEYYG